MRLVKITETLQYSQVQNKQDDSTIFSLFFGSLVLLEILSSSQIQIGEQGGLEVKGEGFRALSAEPAQLAWGRVLTTEGLAAGRRGGRGAVRGAAVLAAGGGATDHRPYSRRVYLLPLLLLLLLLLRPSNGREEVLPAVVVVHGAVVGGREAAVGAAHVRASAQLRQGVVARATLLL